MDFVDVTCLLDMNYQPVEVTLVEQSGTKPNSVAKLGFVPDCWMTYVAFDRMKFQSHTYISYPRYT